MNFFIYFSLFVKKKKKKLWANDFFFFFTVIVIIVVIFNFWVWCSGFGWSHWRQRFIDLFLRFVVLKKPQNMNRSINLCIQRSLIFLLFILGSVLFVEKYLLEKLNKKISQNFGFFSLYFPSKSWVFFFWLLGGCGWILCGRPIKGHSFVFMHLFVVVVVFFLAHY